MSGMKSGRKIKERLSEREIDELVVAQGGDDAAWGKPVRVRRRKAASVSIPADLAARAAFLARLHRTRNVEEWLNHIIQERVELEETVFSKVKHDLASRGDSPTG